MIDAEADRGQTLLKEVEALQMVHVEYEPQNRERIEELELDALDPMVAVQARVQVQMGQTSGREVEIQPNEVDNWLTKVGAKSAQLDKELREEKGRETAIEKCYKELLTYV